MATATLTAKQITALQARHDGTIDEIVTAICANVADHYISEEPKRRANRLRRKFLHATDADRAKAEAALKNAPEEVDG